MLLCDFQLQVNMYSHLIYVLDAYNQYIQATGAVHDDSMGMLSITLDQYEKLQLLYFKIEDSTFELNVNAQIWPCDHRAQLPFRRHGRPCLPTRIRPWRQHVLRSAIPQSVTVA